MLTPKWFPGLKIDPDWEHSNTRDIGGVQRLHDPVGLEGD